MKEEADAMMMRWWIERCAPAEALYLRLLSASSATSSEDIPASCIHQTHRRQIFAYRLDMEIAGESRAEEETECITQAFLIRIFEPRPIGHDAS